MLIILTSCLSGKIQSEGTSRNKSKEKMVSEYDKIIEANPNDISTYRNRAMLKAELRDYNGAMEDLNKIIEINPKDADSYINRGSLKSKVLHDLKGAIKDYDIAISIDPRSSNTYLSEVQIRIA